MTQEIAFSNQCIVFCGDRALRWKALCEAYDYIRHARAAEAFPLSMQPMNLSNVEDITDLSYGNFTIKVKSLLPLSEILGSSRACAATDLRDHIYGCANLASDSASVNVDYTKSVL